MSEQYALADLVQQIIEDSQDEPQFSTREHALMGAARLRNEYLAAHDREVKAAALREAATALFRENVVAGVGDPVSEFRRLSDRADRIESEARP